MRELTFSLGNSRAAKVWRKAEMTVDALYERLKTPVRTAETVAEYQVMKKGEKDSVKDKGGFVAGTLKGISRKKNEVVSRSMITLDADKLKVGFIGNYNPAYFAILYTTHSHTKESPRARILIPLTRDVTPDEYNAIARFLAAEIGMDMVDPCSFEVNQLMFWPTCSYDGEYICKKYDKPWLDPDTFLAAHPDWQDFSKLPVSPTETNIINRERKKQADPLTKDNIIGVFCRAYSIQEVIEKYLSDIYEPTVDEHRYGYVESDSLPGLIIYDDKFAYSHHASDPAYGRLLNAFDLVSVHLFDGDFKKMLEFAINDKRIKELSLKERTERAVGEFPDWTEKLVRNKK